MHTKTHSTHIIKTKQKQTQTTNKLQTNNSLQKTIMKNKSADTSKINKYVINNYRKIKKIKDTEEPKQNEDELTQLKHEVLELQKMNKRLLENYENALQGERYYTNLYHDKKIENELLLIENTSKENHINKLKQNMRKMKLSLNNCQVNNKVQKQKYLDTHKQHQKMEKLCTSWINYSRNIEMHYQQLNCKINVLKKNLFVE